MDDQQFRALMDEIQKNRQEVADLKQEVGSVHEKATQELAQKITKSSYQFKKKSNEIQFHFNSEVEEAITSAKKELEKVNTGDGAVGTREEIKKAEKHLDQGLKALDKRQKHIRVADHSEFGWATVEFYESHPLASDADDEKRLEKAEKEAERAANKRRRGGGSGSKRKCGYVATGPQSSRPSREPQVAAPLPLLPQAPVRPRVAVLGPCFSCGQFGHLAKTCPKKNVYPLNKPVVSKAEVQKPIDVCLSNRCDQVTAVEIPTSEVDIKESVNSYKVHGTDSIDYVEGDPDELYDQKDIDKFWETEASGLSSQITDVQGRLRQNVSFWKDILHAPAPVIDCIENGYRLPLKFLPPPHSLSNHLSTGNHRKFVDEAVQSLLLNRCVVRVDSKPHVCSPLSVVSNSSGKLRLVLNLRYLNQFLHVTKFKYKDLRVAALIFEREEYMFKFDLKSGYHHVDVHPEHQQYLGFSWDTSGISQYFVFAVLPFGLSTACYVFTKLMRPMVRYWRDKGLKAIVYLDDGIIAVKGETAALEASTQVKQDLESAGFVTNTEKSFWVPSKELEWLGFQIDLHKGEFKVPQVKLEKLKVLLRKIHDACSVQARCLAGQHIWPRPSAVRVVYSDASSIGYGGYVVEHGNLVANGHWSASDAEQSSTWRELKAVRLVLESFQSKLENERVRWFSDNQNVVRIVLHGSRVPALQVEALAIFAVCVANHIRIEPEWIPRKQNELADYYSRLIDYNDWRLNPAVFKWLDYVWGPHTVDRFADHLNAHTQRFNSRFWVPGSEAVDTFTCNWSEENNWWYPPVYLIPRVIRHAQLTKARGTLIVPQWPSAPYWPLLFPNGSDPADFIIAWLELPCSEKLFLPGHLGSSLFKGLPNTPVLAMRLNFNKIASHVRSSTET